MCERKDNSRYYSDVPAKKGNIKIIQSYRTSVEPPKDCGKCNKKMKCQLSEKDKNLECCKEKMCDLKVKKAKLECCCKLLKELGMKKNKKSKKKSKKSKCDAPSGSDDFDCCACGPQDSGCCDQPDTKKCTNSTQCEEICPEESVIKKEASSQIVAPLESKAIQTKPEEKEIEIKESRASQTVIKKKQPSSSSESEEPPCPKPQCCCPNFSCTNTCSPCQSFPYFYNNLSSSCRPSYNDTLSTPLFSPMYCPPFDCCPPTSCYSDATKYCCPSVNTTNCGGNQNMQQQGMANNNSTTNNQAKTSGKDGVLSIGNMNLNLEELLNSKNTKVHISLMKKNNKKDGQKEDAKEPIVAKEQNQNYNAALDDKKDLNGTEDPPNSQIAIAEKSDIYDLEKNPIPKDILKKISFQNNSYETSIHIEPINNSKELTKERQPINEEKTVIKNPSDNSAKPDEKTEKYPNQNDLTLPEIKERQQKEFSASSPLEIENLEFFYDDRDSEIQKREKQRARRFEGLLDPSNWLKEIADIKADSSMELMKQILKHPKRISDISFQIDENDFKRNVNSGNYTGENKGGKHMSSSSIRLKRELERYVNQNFRDLKLQEKKATLKKDSSNNSAKHSPEFSGYDKFEDVNTTEAILNSSCSSSRSKTQRDNHCSNRRHALEHGRKHSSNDESLENIKCSKHMHEKEIRLKGHMVECSRGHKQYVQTPTISPKNEKIFGKCSKHGHHLKKEHGNKHHDYDSKDEQSYHYKQFHLPSREHTCHTDCDYPINDGNTSSCSYCTMRKKKQYFYGDSPKIH